MQRYKMKRRQAVANRLNTPGQDARGRPTKFKEEYIEAAKKLCALGATDIEMADFFEVTVTTFYHWKNQYPKFSEAVKVAKEAADNRVERSLYQKATGYTHPAEKIVYDKDAGEFRRTTYREHYAPDTGACAFWLKNRRPEQWRDRQEHTGANGEPLHPTTDHLQQLSAMLDKLTVPDKVQVH